VNNDLMKNITIGKKKKEKKIR